MLQPIFVLDPRLETDSIKVGDLGLSRILLMNDSRFPWLILVPRRADCREIIDLSAEDRTRLMDEIALCSIALKRLTNPYKLNVAAIGNRVSQLHVHLVGRFETDAAWPEPVWGRGPPAPYGADTGQSLAAAVWSALGLM